MLTGDLGRVALQLSLFAAVALFGLSVFAARRPAHPLSKWTQPLALMLFGLVVAASASLITLLTSLNFHYAYVVDYTSHSLPLLYRIAAFWGGDAGSLLFWLLVMSTYFMVVRLTRHADSEQFIPIVSAIMAFVMIFFLLVLNFSANPFALLPVAPPDGNGLNALLQNPGMTVHPVNLYLGYVGFLVPYAYGMAALILRKTDATWLHVTRKWTLVSWLFLSCGIIYGAHWSYEELGWGGYWAWDPIENAALMPWLAATAFLHSAMVQERKGLLKSWNLVLIALTYLLTLFGTALTRGGLLWSIHAFANGSLGTVFMTFVGVMTILTIALIAWRLPDLRGSERFAAALSKESGFLMNNVLFMGALFAVFWGTVFPLVSEAVTGNQLLVSGPFYNTVVLPIGVALIFLMAIGPVLAWRRTTFSQVRSYLLGPAIVSIGSSVVIYAVGYRNLLSSFSYMAAIFATSVIVLEFFRGAHARSAITGDWLPLSWWRMVSRNRRG